MHTIIVISKREHPDEGMLALLQTTFPECRIEVLELSRRRPRFKGFQDCALAADGVRRSPS